MRILLNLVGVVLASVFLLFMAIKLHEVALYAVCGIGILLIVVGFWRDEVRAAPNAAKDNRPR